MLKLRYIFPGADEPVVEAGFLKLDEPGMLNWLYNMVESNPDTIFFFTIETTDIWEQL